MLVLPYSQDMCETKNQLAVRWVLSIGGFPTIRRTILLLVSALWFSAAVGQQSFSYDDIAKRYSDSRLTSAEVDDAKMQGECLVGLKNLNFRKREDFDPVAEWTNYRSLSLLEQFPPCIVLIMMEVARSELIEEAPQ